MGKPQDSEEYNPFIKSEYDIRLYLTALLSKEIRDKIKAETSYNASAGISHNKTLAKIGSS
jgi:nucleotidyltransferase/DNA polymerase involved in DNA repair